MFSIRRSLQCDRLATALLGQHVLWHDPSAQLEGLERREDDDFVHAWAERVRDLGFNRIWLEEAYWAARGTPESVFGGVRHFVDETAFSGYAITSLSLWFRPNAEEKANAKGCVYAGRVTEWWDVPELSHFNQNFAWCVRSEWAYDWVKTTCSRGKIEGYLVGAERFKSAAVLEEIFLY